MPQKIEKKHLSKQDIIAELISETKVMQACTRICGDSDLKHDFFHEVLLAIYAIPEEKMSALYQRNELLYYIVFIATSMWRSPRSSFFKKYRVQYVSSDFSTLIAHNDYDASLDLAIQNIKEEVNNASQDRNRWFQLRLLLYVIELGSIKNVSEKTGIHRKTIGRAIAEAKKHLREKIKI